MQTSKYQFVKVNPINLISKLKLIFAILVPNIAIPQNPSHSDHDKYVSSKKNHIKGEVTYRCGLESRPNLHSIFKVFQHQFLVKVKPYF